ncbi:hypothetical protein [Psychromicrobium sp. YIM B11713]|uniref:hypothetical protein n=1 Tax=Psychromicrobium sp. YIM B11713 TaxID=3145233 RepID=UPI00374ED36C
MSSNLPRLVRSPWGYITREEALSKFKDKVPYPPETTSYDTKKRQYTKIDWTVAGTLENHLGIDQNEQGESEK